MKILVILLLKSATSFNELEPVDVNSQIVEQQEKASSCYYFYPDACHYSRFGAHGNIDLTPTPNEKSMGAIGNIDLTPTPNERAKALEVVPTEDCDEARDPNVLYIEADQTVTISAPEEKGVIEQKIQNELCGLELP